MMEAWRTGIVTADAESIWIRGYNVRDLMAGYSFADTIFLLHQGRLPNSDESKLLNAVLIGVSDHGAGAPSCAAARLVASGNRQSLAAAVAAGILAIGDEHGGAGSACMELIGAVVQQANKDRITIVTAAQRAVAEIRATHGRIPGLGHRVHTKDPRVEVLFNMAVEAGVASHGIVVMQALEEAASAAIKTLPINIDGALAAVLFDLGFPAAAGKLMFIVGRVAGLSAEVAEEYAREKPMRIRIPVQYDGVPPRSK
jgi:citrate synthase